jgi:ADP-ribose pyrophosphatase YjhB (NUDIX family)
MKFKRHTLRCSVYALLIQNNEILLNLRKNTGWRDNYYGLPSGHINKNETIFKATLREINEEIGIKAKPENLIFVHVMHRHEKDNFEYVDFFFVLKKWQGKPINNEPKKSSHIKWFNIDTLPKNIVPNIKTGIDNYRKKIFFSEFKK